MNEFKDLTDKVNRLYLDLREAERQRDENLAKVLALQAAVRELEAKVTMNNAPIGPGYDPFQPTKSICTS